MWIGSRLAWHDALYTPWDSQGAHVEQIGLLGCLVQKTEKSVNSRHAMHQAISARIQHAIVMLLGHLQAFGNFMYSPLATVDDKETAEERVLHVAYDAGPKMTARKFKKARYVAITVLFRYLRLHQGGQSEGVDPLVTVEKMRNWIEDQFGVGLIGANCERDWGKFVEDCFDACNQLDKQTLAPVSRSISLMKKVA